MGYGGAETGCYDIAHYLPENNVKSYLITSGGELLKFIDKKKIKKLQKKIKERSTYKTGGFLEPKIPNLDDL